jgi:gluconokinase
VAQRASHFFPPALVATQFDALESPTGEPGVIRLDALLPPSRLAERVLDWMRADSPC